MNIKKSSLVEKIEEAEELLLKHKNLKAERYLDELIKEVSTNPRLWLLLGIANRRIGKKKKAIEHFKTALDLDSTMIEAWGLLTITLIDIDKIDEAKMYIKKAEQLNPLNKKLRFYSNNLVDIYLRFGPFFDIMEDSDKKN